MKHREPYRRNRFCQMVLYVSFFMLLYPIGAKGKITHLMPMPKRVVVHDGDAAVTRSTPIDIEWVDSIPGAYDYPLAGFPNEAYQLIIGNGHIKVRAITEVGMIRAKQTLAQLTEGQDNGKQLVEACEITDWPAFKLRGYMHDTGRSFIPFEQLEKQLRLFAKFKVNVFHWHLTENQAWRFEVKVFPQLTSAASMTRHAGCYYTQAQCRLLDSLAHTLGMVIIPEIDMPGHSEAFQRAMGHAMQTPQGIDELKTILSEVAEAFPHAPYIHIGADEQTITYPNFIPIITQHIHQLGRRAITWNPIRGIHIDKDMGIDMTQMWGTAGKAVPGIPNIDCRYNYTNHFDVFADLIGIFKSNIYYSQQGNKELAGEISAAWNDRLLPTDTDIMRQNNVYANVLAAAERAWRGGGKQYIEQGGTLLPTEGEEYQEFKNWEERFLFHKRHSLKDESIPYVQQSNIHWLLTDSATGATQETIGATIYLRHTWHPVIPQAPIATLGNTIIASTYIYSPKRQKAGALIELQNYSRSERDPAPPQGHWDDRGSSIYLNGKELTPPQWTQHETIITSESVMGNENLTARPPRPIKLKKGWNHVEIHLPNHPSPNIRLNKWMFTFVITDIDGKEALEGVTYRPTPPGKH